jgi:hypothetical protein
MAMGSRWAALPLVGLDGEERACRFCGDRYTPESVRLVGVIEIDCPACGGVGCDQCPPPLRPSTSADFVPSGKGCGRIHAQDCPCARCAGAPSFQEQPRAHLIQTCGKEACVAAWRRGLGGRMPRPVRPLTAEELRRKALNRALVPDEFQVQYNPLAMANWRGVDIVIQAKNEEGEIRRLDGDLLDLILTHDHPHVYIWGPLQTGKSRTAVNLLDRALARRDVRSATWTTPQRLATELAGQKLGERFPLEDRCKGDRLLVIDDLFRVGNAARSREAAECVERILAERWDSALPTIVTSAVPPRPQRRDSPDADSLHKLMPWYYERCQQGIQVRMLPRAEKSAVGAAT